MVIAKDVYYLRFLCEIFPVTYLPIAHREEDGGSRRGWTFLEMVREILEDAIFADLPPAAASRGVAAKRGK